MPRDHARDAALGRPPATDAKARELSQLLTDVYVTTRTIQLLPAVRRPEPRNRVSIDDDAIDGKRFSVTDAQTVLQKLYHHPAELLSVSEIYVVHDGFCAERGEVPFLMFDPSSSSASATSRPAPARARRVRRAGRPGDEPEQEEGEEYAEIVRQLAQPRRQHPTPGQREPHGRRQPDVAPRHHLRQLAVPSRRTAARPRPPGVLLSVPIYAEADGALKGPVTTIVRLNVLEARLLDWPLVPVTTTERQQAHLLGLDRSAPAEYVLTEAESGIVVSDRRNAALEDIVQGRAKAGLTLTAGRRPARPALAADAPRGAGLFDAIDDTPAARSPCARPSRWPCWRRWPASPC